MPHIFIGILKRAEAYADSEKSLTTPQRTRSYCYFAQLLRLTAIDLHGHWVLCMIPQDLFQIFVVSIL